MDSVGHGGRAVSGPRRIDLEFHNTYEDAARAAAYDQLEFGGTYHLAFRDLPALLREHTEGNLAVDFGCGTGRSTRLLQGLGFRAVGLDISAEMVARARDRDPSGDYQVISDGDFSSLSQGAFDLVLSAFTFDNIPGREHKVRLFSGLRTLLRPRGRLVNIVSTPEMYTHEWVTFTTRAYGENVKAQCGDIVRIVTTDYSDSRPVEDILWPDEDYRSVYREAGLEVERLEKPLATGEEGIQWVSETDVAPWAIYVLRTAATDPDSPPLLGRYLSSGAVNQVQLTRRARTEEPRNDQEAQEELLRFVDTVLQYALPAPAPQDSRYLSRIYRGNAVTV